MVLNCLFYARLRIEKLFSQIICFRGCLRGVVAAFFALQSEGSCFETSLCLNLTLITYHLTELFAQLFHSLSFHGNSPLNPSLESVTVPLKSKNEKLKVDHFSKKKVES